jgi:YD repeat-containing protein
MPRDATTTLNDFPTKTEWTYTLENNQLKTDMTITGFENDSVNTATECDARSIYDGLTVMEQSPAGVKTLYRYDALGRAVETTLSAGSKYQAIKTCSFHLATSGSQPLPMFEETDVNGVRRRTFINGDGLVVRIDIEDVDTEPSVFRTVSAFQYDTQSRVIEETEYDWFPDSPDPITLITQTQYDDWETVSAVISPSGVTAHTVSDPVSLTKETWQTSGSGNKSSGVTVTMVNVSGSPMRIETYDAGRTLQRSQSFIRDGLDRVIEESLDVPGQESIVTRFTYDVFNRIINKVLPDDTQVSWEYAKHSDDNHPLSISLTPKLKTTEST